MAFSFNVEAGKCVSEFNEKLLFSEIQKGKQIVTPIAYGYLIEGNHEPELKKEKIEKGALSRILELAYSSAITRGAEKVIESKNGSVSIVYRGPNSGFNMEYVFKNIKGCWYLVEFIDWST